MEQGVQQEPEIQEEEVKAEDTAEAEATETAETEETKADAEPDKKGFFGKKKEKKKFQTRGGKTTLRYTYKYIYVTLRYIKVPLCNNMYH